MDGWMLLPNHHAVSFFYLARLACLLFGVRLLHFQSISPARRALYTAADDLQACADVMTPK